MSTQRDDRQRVLDATDVVALIGEHVALRAKGREFVGLCPFHEDHNPSMYVVPHKQIFHCFVCGAGGNAIDFAMRYHSMAFPEALRYLAERAGVELTPWTPRAGGNDVQDQDAPGATREEIARANAFALEFFRTILHHPQHGRVGREVIERRGISPEMVETFQLGLAPDRWDGLLKTIEAKHLDVSHFLAAGLLKHRPEADGHYDTFRNRLIFPILDQAGRAIAFGGRIINPEDEPKYLNSPESHLFQKGATLFGLRQAARAIQDTRRAIVTEGYTDVIACHQAGFRNVVATLGTALTEKHGVVLRRLCDEVVVLFDGDDAGQRAAERAFEVFFAEPVDVKVVLLPDAKDPADVLAAPDGAERFARLLEGATDLLGFRFDRLAAALDARGQHAGSAGRARAVEEYIARLVELGLGDLPVIRRRTIVRRLARIAGVDEGTILTAMAQARSRSRPRPEASSAIPAPVRPSDPAQHALACLLAEPGLARKFPDLARDILDPQVYGSGLARTVAQTLARSAKREGEFTLSGLLVELDDAEARSLATAFAAEAERASQGDSEKLEEHFSKCVNEHRRRESFLSREQEEDVNRKLLEVREAHRRLGGNPIAMPKPMV